jgi:NarL family two-component system response regulator LiaR
MATLSCGTAAEGDFMSVRVVLADDHPLFLQGLEAALELEGLEIVGLARSGPEVLEVVTQVLPDAIVLDVEMPGMGGVECAVELRRLHPEVKIVMLSGSDNPEVIQRSLDAGALCFVGKSVSPADIAHALRAVSGEHEIHYNTRQRTALPPDRTTTVGSPADTLTRREREILAMVAEGGSNAQVAQTLWVTEQTVKFRLSNIYRKLEVGNRTQAAARARALGLFSDDLSMERSG